METVGAYVGAVFALIGGAIGFVFDKDGNRAKMNWVRWLGLAMLAGGSAFSLYKIATTLADAAAARAEAVAAGNREAAGQRTMLGGFDFSRPFETGSFYFDVGTAADGSPNQVEGFLGPFPTLGAGSSGLLQINVRDGFYYEFTLRPVPGGGLELANASGLSRPYLLRASRAGPEFAPAGTPPGHRETSRHGGGGPPSSGQWAATGEDREFAYHLGVASPEPLRRIVSGLAGSRSYGSLTLLLPGVSETRKAAIARAYQRIKPYFVFHAPFASGTLNAEHCVSRIRVPMEMRRIDSARADELVLQISATREGFETETCDTAYLP